jgi:hypothetical protein
MWSEKTIKYEIFRSFAPHHPTRPNETEAPIRSDLTLEEAQEHCRDESTSGVDWFDGYRPEEN